MEGFYFAISTAGLNGPNAKKKVDNDYDIHKDKGWTASVRTLLKIMHSISL